MGGSNLAVLAECSLVLGAHCTPPEHIFLGCFIPAFASLGMLCHTNQIRVGMTERGSSMEHC